MKVTLSGLGKDLQKLEIAFKQLAHDVPARVVTTHKQVGINWKAKAIERVPVDTSNLKQHVVTNTTFDKGTGEIETEVGTNVEYGVYVEFGTDYIAGGAVKRLGDGPNVTDADAVRVWAAKNAGLVDEKGKANTTVLAAIDRRLESGRGHEQMPWLRPAWHVIRQWAIKRLIAAVKGD